MLDRGPGSTQRACARRAGLRCDLLAGLGIVLLAVSLYVSVSPIDANLALTALLFRVGEAVLTALWIVVSFAVLQLQLDANHTGDFGAGQLSALAAWNSDAVGVVYHVSLMSYGLGSTLFFYVILKSRYIPRALSAWGLWLLTVGIRVGRQS